MISIMKDPDGWSYLDGFRFAAQMLKPRDPVEGLTLLSLMRDLVKLDCPHARGEADGYLSAFGLDEKEAR